MILGKKVIVVFPAYNAAKTIELTYSEIPHNLIDDVILVDDCSNDNTSLVAEKLGIRHIIRHQTNKGYGGNQKTCYDKALELGADIVVMLHPDYQYTPKLAASMAYIIANGVYPAVFGSRILGGGARKGGMPLYKYIFNRVLTLTENIIIGQKLSEYHTGYRAFSADVLRKINYQNNSDDFVFDNQMIAQIFMAGFEIAEVTCPTKYFEDASSINFRRSMKYGFGVLNTAFKYRFHKWGICKSSLFLKK